MENKQQEFAQNTSGRTLLEWGQGILVLLIGLIIAHFGVTLFLLSELGSDTFTLFVQGLSKTIGLSIGTTHVITLIILMVIMLLTTKNYVKPGTVVCAFCGGWIIDFFLWVFGDSITVNSPLPLRIGIMVLGVIILSFGMSIVIKSNTGTGPNDLVAMILTDKINQHKKIRFCWIRMGCDVIFTLAGVLLGGTLGIGTVAAVFLTGPVVQFFLPISEKAIHKLFPKL